MIHPYCNCTMEFHWKTHIHQKSQPNSAIHKLTEHTESKLKRRKSCKTIVIVDFYWKIWWKRVSKSGRESKVHGGRVGRYGTAHVGRWGRNCWPWNELGCHDLQTKWTGASWLKRKRVSFSTRGGHGELDWISVRLIPSTNFYWVNFY